jgi:mRNA interferase YafQ
MNQIKEAMLLLVANDTPLGPEWQDHPLSGDWEGHRECHIGGDFLLTYRLDDGAKHGMVVFVRAGTHTPNCSSSSKSSSLFHLPNQTASNLPPPRRIAEQAGAPTVMLRNPHHVRR